MFGLCLHQHASQVFGFFGSETWDSADRSMGTRDVQMNVGETKFSSDWTGCYIDVLYSISRDESLGLIPNSPR